MSGDLDPRLIGAFQLALGQPAIVILPSTTMADTEGWDSFAHINLILAIEDAFGIEFDADEIPQLVEVQNIVSALMARGALSAD